MEKDQGPLERISRVSGFHMDGSFLVSLRSLPTADLHCRSDWGVSNRLDGERKMAKSTHRKAAFADEEIL